MTILNHLPATATVEQVVTALRRDNYVIVDELVPADFMNALEAELDPYIDASPAGAEGHLGRTTRRTGALVARSKLSHQLIRHPTILGVVGAFLEHASAYQLMLTQVISIYPGEKAQGLHQDENAWDYFPFPTDYHVQCNTLWALSDYTAEMGATRIVPGSHLPTAPTEYTDDECERAEMARGSVLLYSGKIWHGGGANRSQRVRKAINVNYAVGWVRQEENQYLACPPEVAKTLDDDMLRLIGFQQGAYAMAHRVQDHLIAGGLPIDSPGVSGEVTMEGALALLAADVAELPSHAIARRIIGVTGPPGTGKSTLSQHLVDCLNRDHPDVAALLPMDGFHLSNRQLDRLGRRERKGAPDTFDVDGYLSALRRAGASADDLYVPDFDRCLDEPVAAGLVISAETKLVVTEGNYLALADGRWGSVRAVVDRLYYLDCSPAVRRRRLIKRHVAGGKSQSDARRWVDLVDETNAAVIARSRDRCDRTLDLQDDPAPR